MPPRFALDRERQGFIAELCIALAHRWDPERLFLLIYTGYLDESGTHDGSPITVMGGVLANAKQWARFETEFADIKKRHGFKIFHTKKFKARRGDFTGWSDDQMFALLKDMANLTQDAFTEGVAMKLDNSAYVEEYKSGDRPKKLQLDSKWGLCFRQCLIFFMLQVEKRQHRKWWPHLHVVVESGAANVGAAISIFGEMKRKLESLGCDMFQTITIADKDKCDPLMAADFVAHMRYAVEMKGLTEELRQRSVPPRRGQSAITHLEFKPGGLTNVKNILTERLRKKAAKS